MYKKTPAWLLCLALLSAPGGTCFADGCCGSCTCETCCAAAVNRDGMIAEKDLMNLFREKIDLLPALVEAYTAPAFENAA